MKKFDITLLLTVLFLTFFGLLIIYDASSFIAHRDFGDKYHYIKEQSLWAVLGLAGLSFFSIFNYKRYHNLALPVLIIAIILLILVFIPGLGVYALGARRWVDFKFFVLQPSELVKPALAIYLAAWFSNKEKGRFLSFLMLLGLIVFLVMLQPDMGTTAIITAEAVVIYFLSGGSLSTLGLMLPVAGLIGFILIKMAPYRAARLATFFDPDVSIMTTSYHVRQILISLGIGGLTGVGLGNSLQRYAYLPENTTDSIFAIIAEEFGFIGSFILILLFILVIWRGFLISTKAKDIFGRLLAAGIISFISFQVIINLAAQTALIPLTGVPLPFISYGGSALVVNLCSIGILLNISRQGHS